MCEAVHIPELTALAKLNSYFKVIIRKSLRNFHTFYSVSPKSEQATFSPSLLYFLNFYLRQIQDAGI